MPKYLLVANPISSRSLGKKALARIVDQFTEAGIALDTHMTVSRGDGRRAAADHCSDYDAIVVAGGDGTIAEVIDGLGETRIPVGIIPGGAGNVLAAELGIPMKSRDAVDVILRGKRAAIDSGLADGRRFVLMASAGYDAQVVAYAHRWRGRRFGKIYYFLPALLALALGRFPKIEVEADGRAYRCHHAIVANVAAYGGPMRPARDALHNDGLFDVVMYERDGRWNTVRYGWAALFAADGPGDIIRTRAARVALRSSGRVALQLDGDPSGELPVTLSVAPSGLEVFVP